MELTLCWQAGGLRYSRPEACDTADRRSALRRTTTSPGAPRKELRWDRRCVMVDFAMMKTLPVFNRILLCGAILMVAVISLAAESNAEHDQRMAWFREARFGLFIHWGVYSVPAGEW